MAEDNGNPFDAPLASEVQDHQQAQTARVQNSDNGNPFDEPLMSEKAEANTQPTPAQQKYRKATAAGPFTEPGAAERAMGQTIGDNKAQAIQGLNDVGQAALETGAGVVGASALTAAPEIIPQIVQKAKVVAEWAKANPIKSVALAKIADELGIHPFDLMHSAVRYGKNLFGVSETPNNQ
jgi:hypothetical protein